jgi:membrane-bound metal-dependent hydrolase YbcI (DUF457 family)
MLGRHHLTLSAGSIGVVVLPFFTDYPNLVLVVLVGSAVGSLIPDADSPDAAIFHSEVRGLSGGYSNLLNAPGALYPVFGFATKYLIYKPAVLFYDTIVFDQYEISERHRGFLHSFLGLGTATVITAIYLAVVQVVLGVVWLIGMGLFLIGYLSGAVLHLLQDSCTKSGIQWNFPFQSWEIKGRLTTTAKPEDMKYQRGLVTVLGTGSGASFLLPVIFSEIPAIIVSLAGLLAVTLAWAIFVFGIAKCSFQTQ